MRKVKRDIADMNPLESNNFLLNKLVTYHFWFASPFLDLQFTHSSAEWRCSPDAASLSVP